MIVFIYSIIDSLILNAVFRFKRSPYVDHTVRMVGIGMHL